MIQTLERKILHIEGMTCTGCETRIENILRKQEGIHDVKAIYSSESVYITYDANILGLDKIIEAIEKLDYKVKDTTENQQNSYNKGKANAGGKFGAVHLAGIAIIILSLYVITKNTVGFNSIPQVNQSMGYGILFVIGLLTSIHCIAMCGGVNLSVCVQYRTDSEASRFAKFKPSALYNLGRVASYTVIGGIVGLVGSAVSFSGTAKGVVAIASGVFMVIMGLNMLNIFPWLRKLNPRLPKVFARKAHGNTEKRGPLYIGMLNGLMPCGPLQAIQLYALGTGSPMAGALSMFLFSLGTVPLMFGFGAISSLLSGRFTQKMLKVSAVLVMVLGMVMLNRGLVLSGVNTSIVMSSPPTSGGISKVDGDVQVVTTELESGSYAPIIVQKGIPVKWTIKAEDGDLNGCNNRINIPEFNIENRELVAGDNVIEFIPDNEGNYIYTCWMGMISSSIEVVPDVTKADSNEVQQSGNPNSQVGAGSGCGCCGG